MESGDFKTVSNDIARFLGLTIKRLENEIKSYPPLIKKWFANPSLPQQAPQPSTASRNALQKPIINMPHIDEKPVESIKDIPCDNKIDEIKLDFIFNDLRSQNMEIRKQAQEELKHIPCLLAIKLLERVLDAEKDTLRIIEILNALEVFRDKSPVAKQLFYKYTRYEDSVVKLTALRAIAKYRDEESFNMVSSYLKDKDPEVRHKALNYLCWNFEEKCLPFAITAFHDADHRVRKAAALIMGPLKAEEAMTGLITLLSDSDKDVQESANSSLKKITGKDFGFNASASQGRKDGAIEGWKKWWRENQAKFGRPRYSASIK